MINAEDFLTKCKHCGWHVVDQIDNKDYVCETQYKGRNCYADCKCKYYEPEIMGDYPDMPYQFDNMTGSMNLKRSDRMTNELFERELQNTSINDVSLADYIKENYVPMSVIKDVLDKIRAEIERLHYHPKLDFIKNDEVVDMALEIIDKYKAERR